MSSEHPTPVPARTPTQEEVLDEREQAFRINRAFTQAIDEVRDSLWDVAHWAFEADEASIWLQLGAETKGEWLAWPEIHMTRATFDRMVRVWRETVVRRKVDASTLKHLDVAKTDIAMRAVNHQVVTLAEALSDVDTLGANDMREKYVPRREEDKPDDDEAKPDDTFDEAELETHEPDEPEPEADDPEPDFDEEPNGTSEVDVVLVPRWLVQNIVDTYGPTRRMKGEWLTVLRGVLELEREAAR